MASAHSSLSALLFWFLVVVAAAVESTPINCSSFGTDEVQILNSFKGTVVTSLPYFASGLNSFGNFEFFGGGFFENWNTIDNNPCAWPGVTCNSNRAVEELDLSGWGIFLDATLGTGSLGVLSCLPGLSRLDLSSNRGSLQSLAISEDINFCTGLTYLDLSGSGFWGSIPNISALQSLRYISLENNLLTGELPSLQGLKNLQVLRLAGNLNLTGPLPTDLPHSLVSFDVSNNSFSGTIPSLSGLPNLLQLKLDNNYFTHFTEPVFPDSKRLKYFSVSGNQLEGRIPPSIANISNLEVLNMSQNHLSDEIPSGFSKNLNRSEFVLDLSQNQLTGPVPTELLQNFPNTSVYLNLSYNHLSGTIPALLDRGSIDPLVEFALVLDLSHNNLSGPVPFVENESGLISLLLQNNSLSGDIVNVLLNSPGIQANIGQLQLQNNFFTGDLLDLTSNCAKFQKLSFIDLSNNNLQWSTTDAIPDPLRVLLESCAFNYLLIGGNDFSGISLPSALNVSYQSSGGQYNQSLLEVLNLSNTHLGGMISDGAFNKTWFPFLQILNLSNNHVTGGIPGTILMLPFLADLDVSNNDLSGPLPTIQSSSSLYNPSFFLGNDGLCGVPLSPCTTKSHPVVPWWVMLIIVASVVLGMGSCLVLTWRWRVYRKLHEQDADLIKILLEGESAAIISLRELRRATNNFAKSTQIGEGGFGAVYKGQLYDGTIVAIKRSKREGLEKEKNQFLNEVRILSQVNHRNLVKLLGCSMENKVALLVFEFISNGTLQEHLRGKFGHSCLSWQQRVKIATQTADALNYLHSGATTAIYHRDVKSANILIDDDLNAKVADFGISKLAPIEATHVSTVGIQGTLGYMDPEYYTSFKLSDRSDVYGFGVILLELISAKPAIDFERVGEVTSLVYFANPQIKSGDLQQLIDPFLMDTYNDPTGHGRESILKVGRLALKCLNMQSKARPSMKEVWIELQSLMRELDGASKPLGFISRDDKEDIVQHGSIRGFSNSPYSDRSNSMMEADNQNVSKLFYSSTSDFNLEVDHVTDIEMSKLLPGSKGKGLQ